MEKEKVSIVVPCYNRAHTLGQLAVGIINQSYRPIELILVDDGSTDGTEKLIPQLTEKLEKAGIAFKYVRQENQGVGAAVNCGLKYVTGEYLAWQDSDDELLPESTEVKVRFLKEHPEFGSVSTNAIQFVHEENGDRLLDLLTEDIEANSTPDQMIPLLLRKSLFCPGCHLVRTEVFRQSHGGMCIDPARHGQNLQMLIPVYYYAKHGFINQPLYKYRVEGLRMTAQIQKMNFRGFRTREYEYIQMVKNTLAQIPQMPEAERKKYYRIFKKHTHFLILDMAVKHGSAVQKFFWKTVVKLDNIRYGNLLS